MAKGGSAGELPTPYPLSSGVANGMHRDGRGWLQVTSDTTIGVGVDDKGLPQQMDDLGVQAAVRGSNALEQEHVQLS